jgi:DNA-binding transcriptional regulator YiaG
METEQQLEKSSRQHSSRRLKFEAETEIFKSKRGDLEAIRKSLDLKPAQICRLLKVHPSAWIRWNRTKKAPPHVYQMLAWYIDLQEIQKTQPFSHRSESASPHQISSTAQLLINQSEPEADLRLKQLGIEPSNFWKNALIISWILQGLCILSFFVWLHKLHP